MEFAVGLVVVAIAILITGSPEGSSDPASRKYLSTVAILLAAALAIEGLAVLINSGSDALRVLIFLGRLSLAGAIVVLVNGAIGASTGGGASSPGQQF